MTDTGGESTASPRLRPADVRLLAGALRIVFGVAPMAATAVVVLVLVATAAPVIGVWLSKSLVDNLAAGRDATGLALAYGATLLITAVLQPIRRLLASEVEERTVGEVDRRLMGVGARLVDLHRIEQPSYHDELELLRHHVQSIPRSIQLVDRGLSAPITLVGVLALLVHINPVLPLLLGSVTVAHVLSEARMGHLRHQAMIWQSRPAREMDYCARLTTQAAGAKEVRVFGLGSFFLDRYRARAAAAVGEMQRARLRQLRATGLLALVHAMVVAFGFLYVARRAEGGGLSPGDVALYLNAVLQAETASWGLSFLFSYGHFTILNLRVALPFLEGGEPAIALAPAGQGLAAPEMLVRGVDLEKVSFAYPHGAERVLDELSSHLPAGKVTAVVGSNGAGKTTLVKLLTRMYDPTGGVVLVDGTSLAAYDLASWRAVISAVHQDFARLSLTLQENIALGGHSWDGGIADIERVLAAATWAGVDDVTARLEHGLDTPLTRRFSNGAELSGGEWQKVALARGAMRRAALVVLDEPTAGLDPEAEYRLFQRFRELVAGRTALLISHRFSTVRMADHIIVLQDGRLLESGTHEALVAAAGRYSELYEMQAGRYR